MTTPLTWHDVLAEEKQQPYFINTLSTVAAERQSGQTIYPPQKDVFNAFRYTELSDVKVVILGQDPYHGPGQAHRLAFSVRLGLLSPFASEHVQRTRKDRARVYPAHSWLSGKLGAPGRAVTEYGTHRTCRSGTFSRQLWAGKPLPIKSSALSTSIVKGWCFYCGVPTRRRKGRLSTGSVIMS